MKTVTSEPLLDVAFVRRWIETLDGMIGEAEPLLTELDAAIGDADHGANMTRGLHAAVTTLQAGSAPSPAQACLDVGAALTRSIGGASGPLYGTVFLAMGRALPAEAAITPSDLVTALREALRAVQRIGAAVVGDKTMIDAIAPAVAELERATADGHALPKALASAAEAAQRGSAATVPMRARKGRASYLGARSEGHQDPGATSSALLFRSLAAAAAT
jgi:dihydroxyacetone kinase-like protein